MLQTVTVPAFAAENTTENVEVATNDASTEEESTFNLINADVQIDDEYGNEADYISEVQIPDLEQISEETLVENGVSIHSDYPGDAMVYLTQRWLNQEYGNVPGFGYVTEDGRTGWDTVYGLTRALQVELGITSLADNFGPTTERLYSQNLLRRQDGVTNRKFAILQGALWCKGYNPGYTAKTNSDSSDVSDLEVFYYNDSETIRLTNDSIPDYSVSLLDNELYWISGDSIACISNGNVETRCTIVSELNSNVTRIKALKNSDGKKAIVWQQECDSDVNFYGVNYNEVNNAFGTVEPISTDSGIVRGWDASMLPNGQIELAYGFAEKLQEAVNRKPYGQIDLVQKTANRFYDVHVDPVGSYSGVIEPNKDISIRINVSNNGSMDISQFTVKIIDADGATLQTYTIDHHLAIGDSDELEIPFTLPANIERTNYTIQVYPAGQKDAFDSDNEAILTVGFADISIDNIQESRTETGRTLMVTVKNKGYTPVNSATLKFFKATDKMTLISTEHIASLNPGVEEVFTFNIGMDEFYNDVSGEASSYYFLIETEELESDCGNNSEFVYLYPDYDITLIAGTGGNVSGGGTYVKGDDAILIATPSSGYIFDGWYENGERLYGVSNECKITVDSNRTLEARFKKNDLQITDVEIFGTLSAGETISFTVSATGGVQPWQWEFYIQSDNEVVYSDNAAIVNFTEWTPSQSGTYDFLAFVTDATGKRISYRTQFVVS